MPEIIIGSSDNILKITTLTAERTSLLVTPGVFEAKISQKIEIENNLCSIKIGDDSHSCELVDKKLKINGSLYDVNQSVVLDGIEFKLMNITNVSATLEALFFTNEDIVEVMSAYGYLQYNSNFRAYEYTVPVEVSDDASERFQKITKGMKFTSAGEQIMLGGFLVYYLDDEFVNRLNIPFEMAGKKLQQNNIYISGIQTNKNQAETEKLKIQAALESGKLPKLKMIGFEDFVATSRELVINLSLAFIGIIAIGVLSFTQFKYKKIVLGYFIIAFVLIQAICVVGTAIVTQKLLSPGWILDLYSVLGLFGVTLVSILNMLVLSEYDRGRRFRFKIIYLNLVIFLISFLLLFTGFRGFGLSTIVGLLLTILLFVPIYSQFSKKFFA